MTNTNASDNIIRPVVVGEVVTWTRSTNEGIRRYTGRIVEINPAEARVERLDDGASRYVMLEDLSPADTDDAPAPIARGVRVSWLENMVRQYGTADSNTIDRDGIAQTIITRDKGGRVTIDTDLVTIETPAADVAAANAEAAAGIAPAADHAPLDYFDDERPTETACPAGVVARTWHTTFAGDIRGTGVRVEVGPRGVEIRAFDNTVPFGQNAEIAVGLPFGIGQELAVWLRDRLENDDYSAPATGEGVTDAGDVALFRGDRVRIVGQDAHTLRDMFGTFGTVVRSVSMKLEHGGIQVRFDDGRVTTLSRQNLRLA